LLCFSYCKQQKGHIKQGLDGDLICCLRVKPGRNITKESFRCELLDPINVSSVSMFEAGEELISNVVNIAPGAADDSYEVRRVF